MQLYRLTFSGADPVSLDDATRDPRGIRWCPVTFARYPNEPTQVHAWAITCDRKLKGRLEKSPLVPSLVVEAGDTYQAYWIAKDGQPQHWHAVVAERLEPFFGATPAAMATLYQAPKFGGRLVWKHHVGYAERQMGLAFPWRERPATPLPCQTLVDHRLERALVGALLAQPLQLAQLPLEFGLDVLADFHAQHSYEALCNVFIRVEQTTVALVRAEIVRKVGHADVGWFDALPVAEKPNRLVAGWAAALIKLAAARATAIAAHDTTEAEIDEFALRDVDFGAPRDARFGTCTAGRGAA